MSAETARVSSHRSTESEKTASDSETFAATEEGFPPATLAGEEELSAN